MARCSSFIDLLRLDDRSLKLLRILVGLVTAGDLLERLLDLEAHYTDQGLVPRSLALEHLSNRFWFSLHFANGTATFQFILFLIHILFCLRLSLGCRGGRLNAFVVWLLTCSLQFRNTLILHGGDVLLRQMTFFVMLLPDCAYEGAFTVQGVRQLITERSRLLADWKLCRIRSSKEEASESAEEGQVNSLVSTDRQIVSTIISCKQEWSLSCMALLAQLATMYFFNYINKSGPSWIDGSASYYALQLDYFRNPVGSLILAIMPQNLLAFATRAVLLVEGFGWLLFFSPFHCQLFRLLGFLLFESLHVGFSLCLAIGMFGFITTSSLTCLLPSAFWEVIVPRTCALGWKLTTENSSSTWSQFFSGLRRSYTSSPPKPLPPLTPFVIEFSLESEEEVALASAIDCFPGALSGLIRCQPQAGHDCGRVCSDTFSSSSERSFEMILLSLPLAGFAFQLLFLSSRAKKSILKAVKLLTGLLLRLFFMQDQVKEAFRREIRLNRLLRLSGDSGNNGKGDERGRAGTAKHSYFSPSTLRSAKRHVTGVLAVLAICWSISWCVAYRDHYSFYPPQYEIGVMIHLDQLWEMFAPQPPQSTWYYVIPGLLRNGSMVDLFGNGGMFEWQGRPLSFSRPESFRSDIRRHRWIKFYDMVNHHAAAREPLRLRFAEYICQNWNNQHSSNPDSHLLGLAIDYLVQNQNLDYTKGEARRSPLIYHWCWPQLLQESGDPEEYFLAKNLRKRAIQ